MVDVYFMHHLQVSTEEFLMKQIFSSEILVVFQTQSLVISAMAQQHFLNTYRKVLWHLGMPLWIERQEISQLAIGAALSAVVQSSLLNLSANSYKSVSPLLFFLPLATSRSLAPQCSSTGTGSGCSDSKIPFWPLGASLRPVLLMLLKFRSIASAGMWTSFLWAMAMKFVYSCVKIRVFNCHHFRRNVTQPLFGAIAESTAATRSNGAGNVNSGCQPSSLMPLLSSPKRGRMK